ncbi:hypothetical protein WICPIJ_004576 [Wickerhamomyces pijperi]|uniref:Uncharacterized protein n=1 Tax=Wickerhamomyces pijperi TaxID=599730 RepID=A0A9P8Q542_WICPI|nr:hypothetical protein WICPIJ_004576 [Wickerhamomyces pijperi]
MDEYNFLDRLFSGVTERLASVLAPPLTDVASAMANTTTVLAAQNQATLETNEALRDIQVDLHHRQQPSVTILLNQMGRLAPFTGEDVDPQSVLAFLNGVKLRTDLLSHYIKIGLA